MENTNSSQRLEQDGVDLLSKRARTGPLTATMTKPFQGYSISNSQWNPIILHAPIVVTGASLNIFHRDFKLAIGRSGACLPVRLEASTTIHHILPPFFNTCNISYFRKFSITCNHILSLSPLAHSLLSFSISTLQVLQNRGSLPL